LNLFIEVIMRIIFGLSFLAMSLASWPSFAAAPSLCKPDELTVFSCSTGAHIASICASKDISKDGGTMQYRYGKGDKLDLVYPDAGAKPAEAFTSGTMTFSGGGGAWLRFDKGPFRYTIFTAIGKWARSGQAADASGVAVQKDAKDFANFPCRGKADSELGPDFFEKLGLKAGDAADEFDIPEAFFPK
jgi:hypothetical protein